MTCRLTYNCSASFYDVYLPSRSLKRVKKVMRMLDCILFNCETLSPSEDAHESANQGGCERQETKSDSMSIGTFTSHIAPAKVSSPRCGQQRTTERQLLRSWNVQLSMMHCFHSTLPTYVNGAPMYMRTPTALMGPALRILR